MLQLAQSKAVPEAERAAGSGLQTGVGENSLRGFVLRDFAPGFAAAGGGEEPVTRQRLPLLQPGCQQRGRPIGDRCDV